MLMLEFYPKECAFAFMFIPLIGAHLMYFFRLVIKFLLLKSWRPLQLTKSTCHNYLLVKKEFFLLFQELLRQDVQRFAEPIVA